MSDTGVNKTTFKRVENELRQQQDTVSDLVLRISAMRDEIELLKVDLNRLKDTVTEDIKYLYDRV
jgi:uncharacterized small protein (DUF1192 family)